MEGWPIWRNPRHVGFGEVRPTRVSTIERLMYNIPELPVIECVPEPEYLRKRRERREHRKRRKEEARLKRKGKP